MTNYQATLTFMGEHPFITLLLVIVLSQLILAPFRLMKRQIRSRDIRAKGWPPAHVDADGDFKDEER